MSNLKQRIKFNLLYPSRLLTLPLDKILSFYYSLTNRRYNLSNDLSLAFNKNYISPNAISDHLQFLFDYIKSNKIERILELGVNEGFTTRTFLTALSDTDKGKLISIDINDYSRINFKNKNFLKKWSFIQSCDIEFSSRLSKYLEDNNQPESFDLLFIDTSHTYFHTYLELILYSKYVRTNGSIILHDSNFGILYRRKDNSLGFGFDNKNGVYRAIKDFFQIPFDFNKNFKFSNADFSINHIPYCCGLTIIKLIK